jgi:NAD(P)-dependent dehydrogenase (short-subunit alcohol dehydrogenase family)
VADSPAALVSGANRGIGREIAAQLAGRGFAVAVGGRDQGAADAAAGEIGGGARGVQLDVSDPESVDQAVARVRDELGRLDALVNNAGVMPDLGESAAGIDLDLVREVLETNFLGAWRLAQAALPLLRQSPAPRIVNVSSGAGQLTDMGPGYPGYRASKTALNALTRVLHAELASEGVKVNSVCPGWVRTDMGGAGASRSVQEGADTAVWLATLPDDGPSGGFFRDRAPIPW